MAKKILLICFGILLVAIFIVSIYIFSINLVSNILQKTSQSISTENKTEFTNIQEFKFGNSVNFLITRQRFYGRIYEWDKNSKLYIFNLIPLSLKSNNFSLIKFHLIFIVLLTIFIFIISIFFYRKKEKEVYSNSLLLPNLPNLPDFEKYQDL